MVLSEKRKTYMKKYREEHKEELKEKARQYYEKYKEEMRKKHREYYLRTIKQRREHHREYQRKRRNENREEFRQKQREYYQRNKEKIREYMREWEKQRRKEARDFLLKKMGNVCIVCNKTCGNSIIFHEVNLKPHKVLTPKQAKKYWKNFVPMCRNCHRTLHRYINYKKNFEEVLGRSKSIIDNESTKLTKLL